MKIQEAGKPYVNTNRYLTLLTTVSRSKEWILVYFVAPRH